MLPFGAVLRPAAAADADAISALTRAAYARWVPVLGREPAPMVADTHQAIREHRFDLLDGGGVLLGLIETVPERDALLVENVAVAPACQGHGLGRTLLGHAEAVAANAWFRRIRLYTNVLMTANIRLYERCGYLIDGELATPFGRRVLMSKPVQVPTRQESIGR